MRGSTRGRDTARGIPECRRRQKISYSFCALDRPERSAAGTCDAPPLARPTSQRTRTHQTQMSQFPFTPRRGPPQSLKHYPPRFPAVATRERVSFRISRPPAKIPPCRWPTTSTRFGPKQLSLLQFTSAFPAPTPGGGS